MRKLSLIILAERGDCVGDIAACFTSRSDSVCLDYSVNHGVPLRVIINRLLSLISMYVSIFSR